MVKKVSLSSVLSEFAETMLTDFRIQAILDQLVERIVDVLPISSAGVTLISPGSSPQYVASSDPVSLVFERLQTDLSQGPCLLAYRSGEPVLIPDLAADDRFPLFGPPAVAAGIAAVFTFPMRHGEGRLGALDLYRDTIGALDTDDVAAAQTLANVAAAYLLNAHARQQTLEARDRFRDNALHDALTGLPNRVLLGQRLEHAAARAQRSQTMAAVLFIDLDRFKQVNDTYGHAVGDGLLVDVGARLASLVRPSDTLARISGDEFVILCEDLSAPGDAERLAGRIDRAFAAPFTAAGVDLVITASVGIAYSGPGQAITYQLVSDADAAMYQAKRRGGAAHVIDLRDATSVAQPQDLVADLRAATAAGALDLAYQPIVRTIDGRLTGVEALLRWTHPSIGPIPALTAIAVAEHDDLIQDIGAWVLERGCHDQVSWAAEYPDKRLELSVNVSARQIMGRDFASTVKKVLRNTGMNPADLVLEVTEGIVISDVEQAMAVLGDLRALGVRLALDDFGTGYSSLSYLRRFPVDIIKIDQVFTAAVGREPASAAIVAAVTQLAHVLGMTVTAEGVETADQRDELERIGCENAQGFHYARPMTSQDITAQLARAPGSPVHLPPPAGPQQGGRSAGRGAGRQPIPRQRPEPAAPTEEKGGPPRQIGSSTLRWGAHFRFGWVRPPAMRSMRSR